ncbi:unnamed protein product [Tilletia controversa]|nr:unnamed protein product [Tilletia controversa]
MLSESMVQVAQRRYGTPLTSNDVAPEERLAEDILSSLRSEVIQTARLKNHPHGDLTSNVSNALVSSSIPEYVTDDLIQDFNITLATTAPNEAELYLFGLRRDHTFLFQPNQRN